MLQRKEILRGFKDWLLWKILTVEMLKEEILHHCIWLVSIHTLRTCILNNTFNKFNDIFENKNRIEQCVDLRLCYAYKRNNFAFMQLPTIKIKSILKSYFIVNAFNLLAIIIVKYLYLVSKHNNIDSIC